MCIFGKVLILKFIFVSLTYSNTVNIQNCTFSKTKWIRFHSTSYNKHSNLYQPDYIRNINVPRPGVADELFSTAYFNDTKDTSQEKSAVNLEERNIEVKGLEDSTTTPVLCDTRNNVEEDVRACVNFNKLTKTNKKSWQSKLHRNQSGYISGNTDFVQSGSDIDYKNTTTPVKFQNKSELILKLNNKNEVPGDRHNTDRNEQLNNGTSPLFSSNVIYQAHSSSNAANTHLEPTDYTNYKPPSPPIENDSLPSSQDRQNSRDTLPPKPVKSLVGFPLYTYIPNLTVIATFNNETTNNSDYDTTPLKDHYTSHSNEDHPYDHDELSTTPLKSRTGKSPYQAEYIALYEDNKPSDYYQYILNLPYKISYQSLEYPYSNYEYDPDSSQLYHNSDSTYAQTLLFPPRIELDVSPLVDLIYRLRPSLGRYYYPPKPYGRTDEPIHFPRPPYHPIPQPDLDHQPPYHPYKPPQSYNPNYLQHLYDQYLPYDPSQPPRTYQPLQPPYESYPFDPSQRHNSRYDPYKPPYNPHPPFNPLQPPYDKYSPFDPPYRPHPTYEPYPSFEPPEPTYETYPPFELPSQTEDLVDKYVRTTELNQPSLPNEQDQLDSKESYDSLKPSVPSHQLFNTTKPDDKTQSDEYSYQDSPSDITQAPQSSSSESEESTKAVSENGSHLIPQENEKVQSTKLPISVESSSILPGITTTLESSSLLTTLSQTAPPPPEDYYQFYSDET